MPAPRPSFRAWLRMQDDAGRPAARRPPSIFIFAMRLLRYRRARGLLASDGAAGRQQSQNRERHSRLSYDNIARVISITARVTLAARRVVPCVNARGFVPPMPL